MLTLVDLVLCLNNSVKENGSRPMVTKKKLKQWIEELIQSGELYKFYKSKQWQQLKAEVLKEAHGECVKCKAKGKVSLAVEVHHVQWVKKHPELALSRTYTYNGKTYQNLLPLCHSCHDEEHERFEYKKQKQFNEERW